MIISYDGTGDEDNDVADDGNDDITTMMNIYIVNDYDGDDNGEREDSGHDEDIDNNDHDNDDKDHYHDDKGSKGRERL